MDWLKKLLESLKKFIEGVMPDKKNHLLWGDLTGLPIILAFYGLFSIFGRESLGVYLGGAIAVIWYAYKEYRDWRTGLGKAEFMDWFWTSFDVFKMLIFYAVITDL